MTPRCKVLSSMLVAALVLLLFGCQGGRKGSDGFRLPDGDPAKGRQVAIDMKCHSCHEIVDSNLPAPSAVPPVPVVLGGRVPYEKTDGELVTSIINPSHRIVNAARDERVKAGGLSRMPDYGETMTVRQMIDLVAFLHGRYRVIRPGVPK